MPSNLIIAYEALGTPEPTHYNRILLGFHEVDIEAPIEGSVCIGEKPDALKHPVIATRENDTRPCTLCSSLVARDFFLAETLGEGVGFMLNKMVSLSQFKGGCMRVLRALQGPRGLQRKP